jgi:UDP-glucose 4-epimerase
LESGGCSIRVVDNLSVGSEADLATAARGNLLVSTPEHLAPSWGGSAIELVVTDVRDEAAAAKAVAGADVVVHLAAETGVPHSILDPLQDCTTNVLGTLNYLEACRVQPTPRFVFASSGAPIGECTPPIHEELAPHPVSPYGASKLAGEGYCSAYYHCYGVEAVALRFSNVYGPGSGHKSSVVARFIGQALCGKALEIYGDGAQTRDFLFVDDLVSAVILAATAPAAVGNLFQIAMGYETSLIDLISELSAVMARAGLPHPTVQKTSPRLGDVKRNYADISKAKSLLGWSPKVSLAEGLHETLMSFLVGSRR